MRKGEHSEGLPGSILERGMCQEKRQGTWETRRVPERQRVGVPAAGEAGRPTEKTSRRADGLSGVRSVHNTLRRENRSHTAPAALCRCGEGTGAPVKLARW